MVYLSACVMNVYTIFLFSSLSLYLVSSQVQQLETTLTIVQPPAQPPQLTTPTNSSNQNPPPADLTLNSSNQITPLPGPVCDTLNVTSPLTVGSPATSNVTGSSQKPPGRVPGTSNQTAPLTADSSVTFNATRASQKPLGRVSDTFNQSAPLKVNSTGSTQKSPPSVAQLILPPEAAILPETPESKILVPSQKNDNLPTAIKIAVPHDPTLPPPGSIIVGRQPKPGEHGSIGEALVALAKLGPGSLNITQTIFIYPGQYNETVVVLYKGPLRMIGYTRSRHDYRQNRVNITGKMDAKTAGSNDKSATVRIIKDDFAMYNINVFNTYGKQGIYSQAIALSATGSKQAYYACSFFGYQDTLLTLNGFHYYSECYIEGAVDFIFTQKSIAWFENVTTASIAPGYVTANGRSDVINPSRYVFNRARVVSNGAGIGTVTLGRPWGNFSRVTFQNSYLSEVVNPVGWSSWKVADERTNHAKYNEYNNHGPGAILFPSGYNTTSKASRSSINNGTTGSGEKGGAPIVQNATTLGVPPSARADFSYNLKRPYVVSQLLGKDYQLWVDPEFPVR